VWLSALARSVSTSGWRLVWPAGRWGAGGLAVSWLIVDSWQTNDKAKMTNKIRNHKRGTITLTLVLSRQERRLPRADESALAMTWGGSQGRGLRGGRDCHGLRPRNDRRRGRGDCRASLAMTMGVKGEEVAALRLTAMTMGVKGRERVSHFPIASGWL